VFVPAPEHQTQSTANAQRVLGATLQLKEAFHIGLRPIQSTAERETPPILLHPTPGEVQIDSPDRMIAVGGAIEAPEPRRLITRRRTESRLDRELVAWADFR